MCMVRVGFWGLYMPVLPLLPSYPPKSGVEVRRNSAMPLSTPLYRPALFATDMGGLHGAFLPKNAAHLLLVAFVINVWFFRG